MNIRELFRSQRLLENLLSAWSLGPMRMFEDDSPTSWRVDHDDEGDSPSLEGGEPGNQGNDHDVGKLLGSATCQNPQMVSTCN